MEKIPLAVFDTILCSLVVICIIGGGILAANTHDERLIQALRFRRSSKSRRWLRFLPAFLLLFICTSVLVFWYYFYDILVYPFIGFYAVLGAYAMAFVFTSFLYMCAPSAKRYILRMRQFEFQIVRLILFLAFLALTITWCVFRNKYPIGMVLLNLIGVFILIYLHSILCVYFPFKDMTILFFLFIIFDVFFFYVTPFLVSSSFKRASPSRNIVRHYLLENGSWIEKNSSDIRSFYDSMTLSVVLGYAGSSGEFLPITFKVQGSSLNFADVFIPGFFCAYLAFYEACWKRKISWICISSIIGYILGLSLTLFLSHNVLGSLAALPYICPPTYAVAVLGAFFRGGIKELRSLWIDNLPNPPETVPDRNGDHELVPDNENALSYKDQTSNSPAFKQEPSVKITKNKA